MALSETQEESCGSYVKYKIFFSDRNLFKEPRLKVDSDRQTLRQPHTVTKKSAEVRVRARIRARLEELGMTGRELAHATGHKDAWISGILKGYQSLSLEDFDAVAAKLNVSPSELVRHDDAVVRELTPREMRVLRHYQGWPADMQDRWLAMLDFFAATVPDKETATLLDRVRALPRSLRRPVLAALFRFLEEGIPPEALTGGVVLSADEQPTEPASTHPSRTGKRRRDGRAQS